MTPAARGLLRIVWLQKLATRKALGRLILLLMAAMAVACFWPFSAPRNSVSWIPGGHGVLFGKHGILIGPGPLRPDDTGASGCTLDLWVEASPADFDGAIFSAYSAANPRLLRIEQLNEDLVVRSLAPGEPARVGGGQVYADGVFAPGKPLLLTITSDEHGTKAFVNGVVRRTVPDFGVCHAVFTGRFVAGTAVESHYSWGGRLAGMAIFDHALSPGEVQGDYRAWPDHPGPALGNRTGLAALYLFDEGSGSRVRDEVSRANSFYMPDRYIVLAQSLLSSPSFDNYLDIVLNIIGFMPLGFMLCGYLGMRGAIGASFAKTVLLCGLFSLLIESLQWFLPTRDSDMTDVITNIAGSAVGALLYTVSRRWLVSLGKLTQ